MEDRYPQVFEGLQEKMKIDDDLEKLMLQALKDYDEEFKDTIN
jgi:hypothetical protein